MAAHKTVGQAKLAAQIAHFVFKQFAQRLDQLQIHLFRQAAHIVVRFDGHRGTTGKAHAFDHVRIKRALRQELSAAEFLAS